MAGQKTGGPPDRQFSFELTPYDFPLTDNMPISAGFRFAIVLDHWEPGERSVWLNLIWFPPQHVAERERPYNYEELRKALRLR